MAALGNDLLRSAARLSRWANRSASFEVAPARVRLLALLEELGPSRVSTLAVADHCSQPTMTAQVQRLEACGAIQRIDDPHDARAALVGMTDAGRDLLRSARRARVAALEPVLARMDHADQQRLQTTVDVLRELLDSAASLEALPRKD